jgi:hypothetical protein
MGGSMVFLPAESFNARLFQHCPHKSGRDGACKKASSICAKTE